MPIAALRRFIQTTLSLSPKIQVKIPEIFDFPHPVGFSPLLLQVSIFDGNNRLLKDSHRLSSLRHTASSASFDHIPLRLELINPHTSIGHCRCSNTLNDSSLSELITSDCIDQILSTIPLTFVRSSLSPTSSSRDSGLSESMLDDITSNFGEIFPANSCRLVAETSEVFVYQMMPLDLSMHDE